MRDVSKIYMERWANVYTVKDVDVFISSILYLDVFKDTLFQTGSVLLYLTRNINVFTFPMGTFQITLWFRNILIVQRTTHLKKLKATCIFDNAQRLRGKRPERDVHIPCLWIIMNMLFELVRSYSNFVSTLYWQLLDKP